MSKFLFTLMAYALLGSATWGAFQTDSLDAERLVQDSCFGSVPNAFSPNGDGVNDTFQVKSSCTLEGFNMKIYSDQNALIHEMHRVSDIWNGYDGNEPSPEGRYTWRITYDPQNGKRKILRGEIVLVR